MFKLSPFRIVIFRQCPRRYKYHYVDGLYELYRKPQPHFTMGEHVHAALSAFLSRTNRDRTFEALEKLFRNRWNTNREGFETREQENKYKDLALHQLRWFYDTQNVAAQPYMVEAPHQVSLSPGLTLMGRVDRVDRCEDGSFHIIDYKTGKTRKDSDNFQLLAYAVLLNRKFKANISRVSYLFLNGDGWRSIEPRAADLDRTQAQLFAIRDEITAEQEYPARPSALCRWCDFTELCDVRSEPDWDYEPPDDSPF